MASNKGRLKGRLLSLYDASDSWMGSCREVFADNPDLRTQEIVLQSGLQPGMGHSLFYALDKIWIDPKRSVNLSESSRTTIRLIANNQPCLSLTFLQR
jgi:hypothetical protein